MWWEQSKTKCDVERGIKEATGRAVAALLGGGVGLILSIVFLPAGVVIALLAVPVALAGWGAAWLICRMLRYQEVSCERCGRINLVRVGAESFSCSSCGRFVGQALAAPMQRSVAH
ncbi:MAG: hypothetical protein HYX89_07515 [Chloroflexi bacterium]|nr:hypothetical protein [Chloroflexota bacterium]